MDLQKLSDSELVSAFQDLVYDEQERLALALAHIAELDRRKLFYHYKSLRAYLVAEHGLEESVAERRIRAARLMRKLPWIQEKIERGQLNLTLLELAMGCAYREKLKDSDLSEILEVLCGMSCEAAKRELAARYPESVPEAKDRVRRLTDELSEVRFVAHDELLEKLDEIRGLLAHSHPKLSIAELIDILATDYRARHHPEERARRAIERKVRRQGRKREKTESPTAPWVTGGGKVNGDVEKSAEAKAEIPVPVPVKDPELQNPGRIPSAEQVHALIQRDGYQCGYVDKTTRKRCTSRFGLEIHHEQDWALGGETKLSNLSYACRQHHRRLSFLQWGESAQYFAAKPR